jgi:hypothetical protein
LFLKLHGKRKNDAEVKEVEIKGSTLSKNEKPRTEKTQ